MKRLVSDIESQLEFETSLKKQNGFRNQYVNTWH